jgi:hypothetical protein
MSAKKTNIDNADIEVANQSWSDENRKAFSEFLKARKKSIYSKRKHKSSSKKHYA